MNRKFNIIKIIVLLFCAFQVNAQNTLDNLGLSSSTPASVAYSLRLLSTSYTGPLVRIRIGSSFYDVYPDTNTKKFALSSKVSAVQSVYNSASAIASSNALSSIITSGTTNATVAIWYDQSGNAINVLTNSVTGPKIITLGSINKMNGQPTMYFDTANQNDSWWLTSEATVNYSAQQAATINSVVQNIGSTNNLAGIYSNGGAGWGLMYNSSNGYWLDGWGCNQASSGTASTTPKIVTGFLNKTTSTSSIYENSILKQTKSITCNINNGTTDHVYIGERGYWGNLVFDGTISEVILFPTNLSTIVQSTLETNQNTNYFTPSISLTSAVGTNVQSLCSTTAITAITYETSVATGATFSGLPAGVSGTWLNNLVTIAGTPTVFGTNNYTVTLTGIPETVTATGTITYQESPTVTLSNSPATVCSNIPANFNGSSICGPNGAINSSASSRASRALLTNLKDNVTMETWVKWSGTASGYQIIFYNGHTGNGGYGIITNSSGNLQILIGGKSFLNSSLYLTPGIWQHVAIVRNAGTWSIYLNGIQYSVNYNNVVPNNPNVAAGNGTFVGKDDSGNQLFAGDIDELKFWTVVRSTSEIQSDMKACTQTAATGLLAYWSLNDATGNTALDGSGNSKNLSITNPNWISAGAPTGGSYAIDFGDGTLSSLGADTHTYTTAGTYNVTINATATNGCTSTATNTITVNQSLTATISGTTTGCAVVSLTAGGGTTYAWSGGNTTTTASNTFNNSGNYTVTATDAIGCWNKATQSVTINPLPISSFIGAVPTSSTYASISSPAAFVFDTSGNLFIAASSDVNKVSPDGTISTFATGFSLVSGITIDALGNLFVTDKFNRSINKISPEGVVTTFVSGLSFSITYLNIDSLGNLFLIDGSTIKKITSSGVVSTFVSSGLSNPKALTFDALGNLYVANFSANTISKVTLAGEVSTFASGLSLPQGLAFDNSGILYVSNKTGGVIKKVFADGTISPVTFGLSNPLGLAFDTTGNLYTITSSNTITKLTLPAVNITTVCSGNSVTLIATPATGEEIDWYAAATGGTALLTGSNNYVTGALAATTTYYAESRNTTTGCVAATRTPITATINPTPVVTITASNTSIIVGESVTLTAAGANSYLWVDNNTTSLGTNEVITLSPTQTSTYSVTGYSTDGLCSSSSNATITVIYNANLGNFNDVTKSFYDGSYTITPPTTNSSGAVTYASSNTNVATISGTTVTIVGIGTSIITATQAAESTYCSNFITATLTVNSVTVLTKNGEVSTTSLSYVNKNGALSSSTSLSINGEVISTKSNNGLTAANAGSSAYQIKTDFPNSVDGMYWIKNPNINGGTPFQIYADMTTNGGGWTLILSNNSSTGWNGTNAILRNENSPTIDGQYSIIAYADYIKKGASGFQYMIDATTRRSWGGIWTANEAYSFVHTSNDQTNVTINTKFNSWDYNDQGVEQIMPWYTPGSLGAITTSTLPSDNSWGTLVSSGAFSPVPWMNCCNQNPGIIWYWVR